MHPVTYWLQFVFEKFPAVIAPVVPVRLAVEHDLSTHLGGAAVRSHIQYAPAPPYLLSQLSYDFLSEQLVGKGMHPGTALPNASGLAKTQLTNVGPLV